MIRIIVCCLAVFSFPLFSEPITAPFGVITVPKTGTHLILKCLSLLQDRSFIWLHDAINRPMINDMSFPEDLRPLDRKIDSLLNDSHFFLTHAQLRPLMERLMERNSNFKVILGIRDLRDVLVSQTFFRWPAIERTIGPSTLQEKIKYLLKQEDGGNDGTIVVIRNHAEELYKLFHHPNALVVRFEDLVGSKGGGDDALQRQTILNIAHHLNIPISPEKLTYIQENLFGIENSSVPTYTFRSGHIGSWREAYNPKLLKIFNRRFGSLQMAFGYSLD